MVKLVKQPCVVPYSTSTENVVNKACRRYRRNASGQRLRLLIRSTRTNRSDGIDKLTCARCSGTWGLKAPIYLEEHLVKCLERMAHMYWLTGRVCCSRVQIANVNIIPVSASASSGWNEHDATRVSSVELAISLLRQGDSDHKQR
ncbi:hypothetical protein CY34DRAFT_374736 [Suillus luteus UH-Slu-Lm8-n1]|uniref:Uncharacterized protein n=1 Tax=Suillus luteus UH-Slu-Lm8-n1 TaxID=930992 RepID=A0A0D0AA90_9AGAM|nr:hypothetical protein CY34DRAFT_374736 [Suillus luteus UH-Slu-Lm8-n1]